MSLEGTFPSGDGGSLNLTIADGGVRGPNIACRAVWIQPRRSNSGTLRVSTSALTDAVDTGGMLISDITHPLCLYINNLSVLSFKGSNDGDRVEVLYRT